MPDESQWFELADQHGIDHDGNLQPIAEIGLSIPAPQRVGGDILPTAVNTVMVRPAERLTADVAVRTVPGTRIIETRDHRVADAIVATRLFHRIDPPSEKRVKAAADETQRHIQALAERDAAVARGDMQPPDVTDHPPVEPPAPTSVVFTADERNAIDNAILGGSILSDPDLAAWVTAAHVPDLITEVGEDILFAKRVLMAEQQSGRARKTLIEHLEHLISTDMEGGAAA